MTFEAQEGTEKNSDLHKVVFVQYVTETKVE